MKVFVTSDHHWGHKNIIKYCDRPFSDNYDQSVKLTKWWNEVVDRDDVVYHLGDVAFDKWEKHLPWLRGQIRVMPGNHDKPKLWAGYESLLLPADGHMLNVVYEGRPVKVGMHHYPLWNVAADHAERKPQYSAAALKLYEECDLFLYGHTHNHPEPNRPDKAVRVCVEDWSYRPVELTHILRMKEHLWI